MAKMRIAIIGAGNVGSALGLGWAKCGHGVIFGVRDPDAPELIDLMKKGGPNARALPSRDAAEVSEVIVLTVPWPVTEQVIRDLGSLRGKIVFDCTNPVMEWPRLDHTDGKSGGEQVAEWAKGARVVKIFNSTGFENMQNPRYAEGGLTMFYAGHDAAAKGVASALAEDLGFEGQDCGSLAQSYALEVIASLWGTLAYGQQLGRGFGFRLIKR
jgi:8-hydroxy-5-deazaflavin:NADPH oxidoreductase